MPAQQGFAYIPFRPACWQVCCIGNSLTLGIGTPDNNGFRKVFHDGLTSAGVSHVMVGRVQTESVGDTLPFPNNRNEGYGSNTIADITARVAGMPRMDIACLDVFTVDVALGRTVQQMIDDTNDLIDLVREHGVWGILLSKSIPQGPPSGGSDALMVAINAEVAGIVANKSSTGAFIGIVDQYTGFNIAWCSDGVHVTNPLGQTFMGNNLTTACTTLIAP